MESSSILLRLPEVTELRYNLALHLSFLGVGGNSNADLVPSTWKAWVPIPRIRSEHLAGLGPDSQQGLGILSTGRGGVGIKKNPPAPFFLLFYLKKKAWSIHVLAVRGLTGGLFSSSNPCCARMLWAFRFKQNSKKKATGNAAVVRSCLKGKDFPPTPIGLQFRVGGMYVCIIRKNSCTGTVLSSAIAYTCANTDNRWRYVNLPTWWRELCW